MPKVSIIIPFNNVEKYIEQCLDSVLCQTLQDIEVILVNDASTDSTRDIVQRYVQKDSRIRLIDLEKRSGQGFARNRAIESAQGDYIGFVDSDDFVDNSLFEKLYNNAVSNDTDITMCQVKQYDDTTSKYVDSDYYSLTVLEEFENRVFSAEDTKEKILNINVALWNKIYKREYLLNTGEKFPEGYIYEDLPFFFGSYLPAKRLSVVWEYLYFYRINRKNSTMSQFNNKVLDRVPMVSLTYEKMKKAPFLKGMEQKIQGWIIDDLFHRYTLLEKGFQKEFFFEMKKVFSNLNIENPYDDSWKTVYHFNGYRLVMNNNFEEFNQKLFTKYLDMHEIEYRLRSQIVDKAALDKIYNEISKNYSYTTNLYNGIEERAVKNSDKIKNLNERINDTNVLIYEKMELLAKSYDETLSSLQKEICEINEINKSIYSDIKDLSYVQNDSNSELKEKIEVQNKNINAAFEQIKNLKTVLSETAESNKSLLKSNYNLIADKINLMAFNYSEQHKKDLAEIEKLYGQKLKEQRKLHQEEIIAMNVKMEQMIKSLREEMKNPLQKFMEKYKTGK